MKNWFEVDRRGLAKLLERRGRGFILLELLQNAFDERSTFVSAEIQRSDANNREVTVTVVDDSPQGFKNLTHAFTLFAESDKKADPTKRGRFNLGEKLVLALCREATIISTTGGVRFDEEGRHAVRERREVGTIFRGIMRMTREEQEEAERLVRMVIPPVKTQFNQVCIDPRTPIASFETQLPTELTDNEGLLRRTARKCRVEVYEPNSGETPSIYEMGIPVVETGDRFHVNVCQKVPLNMDRDNVPPAYLQTLRTLVLNATRDRLTQEDATAGWARSGADDPRCDLATTRAMLDLRFGENRVSADPSDPEAGKRAAAAGYTVVPGGALSKQEWENARGAALIPPAGRIFPTPKPFSPNGLPLMLMPEDQWTPDMRRVHGYAVRLAERLLGRTITCQIADEPGWHVGACFGPSSDLYLNVGKLGRAWFKAGNESEIDCLLLHEFAHHDCGDHLSDEYHRACCRLGAKLKRLALQEPDACRL